jgi:tRNA modification GTPase
MSATAGGCPSCFLRPSDPLATGPITSATVAGESATIFAVASGTGQAAITVLRISGPHSARILDGLCRRRPPPRVAALRTLRNRFAEVLDRAIVLWLPGPGSYTGEDSAELHLHGGRAVLAAISDALLEASARPAEPGEFTRRAFLNGRLELLQAEAIADLVAAETDAQRRQALTQLDGGLGAQYRNWTVRLTQLLAAQEGLIDFPDEGLPLGTEAGMATDLALLRDEIAAHLDDRRSGERLRDGLTFVITGPPNSGKSTLINVLVRREVAIVSPQPGTTRDVLEVRLDIGGVPVALLDTAGLRETDDPVEAEGVRRALARAAEADFVIELVDATSPVRAPAPVENAMGTLRVATKVDLAAAPAGIEIGVSALTGLGLDRLRDCLVEAALGLTAHAGPPPLTRARHRAALVEAVDRLTAATGAALPELRGEDMRLALRAIGRVTGQVGVEDILDSVFGQFCIGK